MKKRFATGTAHWTQTDAGYKAKLLVIKPFVSGVLYAVCMLNAYAAFATSARRLLLALVDLPSRDALIFLLSLLLHHCVILLFLR